VTLAVDSASELCATSPSPAAPEELEHAVEPKQDEIASATRTPLVLALRPELNSNDMPELEPGLVVIFAAREKIFGRRASELVAATRLPENALPVATTPAIGAGNVAVPAVLRVGEHVGEAACLFSRTVEAEQASGYHARFAVTAGDGVGQPTRCAFRAGAAISRIAEINASVAAQFSVGAAALVDVGRIDDQRTTQCAEPAGGDDRADERASKHQN
jgi:hypothetical protein